MLQQTLDLACFFLHYFSLLHCVEFFLLLFKKVGNYCHDFSLSFWEQLMQKGEVLPSLKGVGSVDWVTRAVLGASVCSGTAGMNSSLQPLFCSLDLSLLEPDPNFSVCLLLSLWLKLPAVFGWLWARQFFCSCAVSVIPQACPAKSQPWAGFAVTQQLFLVNDRFLWAGAGSSLCTLLWAACDSDIVLVGVAHWVHAQVVCSREQHLVHEMCRCCIGGPQALVDSSVLIICPGSGSSAGTPATLETPQLS